MRPGHFEALRPVCPACRANSAEDRPLSMGSVFRERDGIVLQGSIHCTHPGCFSEFPIVDGVPIILANLREFVGQNIDALVRREDLSPELESLLGDCAGPNSAFDVARQHLSNYGFGHYGDLDPDASSASHPASILPLVSQTLGHAGECPEGPALDVGCAVGRATFETAARTGRLTLGVDVGLGMLRMAQRVLAEHSVRHPLRRVGVVYDRREFSVEFPNSDLVDFWACDATALPFVPGSFALALSLNLVDCVVSPLDHLASVVSLLAPAGRAAFACPYDWSPGATEIGAWVGGHSQRSETEGRSEPILRALLTPGAHPASLSGLEIVAENEHVPWGVRVHDRSTVTYDAHLIVARAAD